MLDRGDAGLQAVGDTVATHGVGGRAAAGLARLLDGGAHLVERELGRIGLDARGHDPAGGEDLDDVGAGLELLAHGLARVVGTIGLAADQVPAVAARHADALAGAQHARAGDEPLPDGVAHAQLGVLATAEVAHGGDAGLHRLPGAQRGLDDGQRLGVTLQAGGGIGLATEAEVHVHVDEAGQEREAVQAQRGAGRRLGGAHHRADAAVLDDDGAAGHRRRPGAVEQQRAGEDRALHAER